MDRRPDSGSVSTVMFAAGRRREVFTVVLAVRGVLLPDREHRVVWIDGDRLRTDSVPGAELVSDGDWVVPGLVDMHTHPGAERPGDPFDEELLRRHLREQRDAGVLAVRVPGSVERLPAWVDGEVDLPRVRSAGPWLATPGHLFPGHGREVTEAELVTAAVEEASASSG